MSHGDRVDGVSRDFEVLARTKNCPLAAVRHRTLPFYGVQFHPEVHHTPQGPKIIRNFLRKICRCKADWTMEGYVKTAIREIREKVGTRDRVTIRVVFGCSPNESPTQPSRIVNSVTSRFCRRGS